MTFPMSYGEEFHHLHCLSRHATTQLNLAFSVIAQSTFTTIVNPPPNVFPMIFVQRRTKTLLSMYQSFFLSLLTQGLFLVVTIAF